MNGYFYEGYVPNYFYPSRSQAASPQKGFSSIGLTNWMKIATIVIMVMLFIVIILGVVTITSNPSSSSLSSASLSSDATVDSVTCPCPGTSDQSLFFPYGLEAGDVESFSDVTFPIDSSIVYKVFGNNQNANPVVLETSLISALIKVGYYDGTAVNDPYAKIFLLNGAVFVDPTDDADRHTYYRRATKSDEQIINCIIPDFTTSEAYVVTWVNVMDSTTQLGLGTFQGIVAFGANSEVYLIRNYGPDVPTVFDGNKPMKIVDKPDGINYEADSIVADFLGKREILLISVFSATQTFPRITEQLTTTEC